MPRNDARSYSICPDNAIHWDRADQALLWKRHHFRLVPKELTFPYKRFGNEVGRKHVIAEISIDPLLHDVTEASAKRIIKEGAAQSVIVLEKANNFIRQQIVYGYTGAWLDGCGSRSHHATWFKRAAHAANLLIGRTPKLIQELRHPCIKVQRYPHDQLPPAKTIRRHKYGSNPKLNDDPA